MVHETLDDLCLGVCLLQPPLIDACDRHSARVALGLDREDAAGPNHDVVHVPARKFRVMNGEPACGAEVAENCTDMLLAVSPATPSIDDRQPQGSSAKSPATAAISATANGSPSNPNRSPTAAPTATSVTIAASTRAARR